MKTLFNLFIISILTISFASAQLDGTYKSLGSEAGRTVLTVSDNETKFHVSYIDGNYTSHSLDGSLQKISQGVFHSVETVGCGSPTERSQNAVEISVSRQRMEKTIKLEYKYCDGNAIKSVGKTFVVQIATPKKN